MTSHSQRGKNEKAVPFGCSSKNLPFVLTAKSMSKHVLEASKFPSLTKVYWSLPNGQEYDLPDVPLDLIESWSSDTFPRQDATKQMQLRPAHYRVAPAIQRKRMQGARLASSDSIDCRPQETFTG